MPKHVEQYDDDEMSEILKRAVRLQGSQTTDLRQRLLATADELGISHDAVAQAEVEYRQESQQRNELALYTKESRNALRIHFGVYMIVNAFMIGLNLMTFHEDREIWFPYVLLSWGVGLGIHAFVAMRKIDWDDEEFQKWRRERTSQRQVD